MTNFSAITNLFIYRGMGSQLFPVAFLVKKGFSSSGPVKFVSGKFYGVKKAPSLASPAKESNGLIHAGPSHEKHASGLGSLEGKSLQASHYSDEICSSKVNSKPASESTYKNENEENTNSLSFEDGFRTTHEDIEQVAVGLLSARAMTLTELRKKLRGKKFPHHTIESVLVDFKSRGMLNDGMYAESFTRSRWLSSTWGPRRIKLALRKKGVGEKETEKARKLVFEDDGVPETNGENPEDNDEDTPHGASKVLIDHLFLQASKQWQKSQGEDMDKRKTKIARWIQYRGFNWQITKYIVKRLESQQVT